MAGKRVLIVTHAGTIWSFRYVIERWTYEEAEHRFRSESIPNGSMTAYEREPFGRLTLRTAGEIPSASGPAR